MSLCCAVNEERPTGQFLARARLPPFSPVYVLYDSSFSHLTFSSLYSPSLFLFLFFSIRTCHIYIHMYMYSSMAHSSSHRNGFINGNELLQFLQESFLRYIERTILQRGQNLRAITLSPFFYRGHSLTPVYGGELFSLQISM